MLIAILLACGTSTSSPLCADDDTVVVADGLTCADAKVPTRAIRVLTGRPLIGGTTDSGVREVVRRYASAPDPTREWITELSALARNIERTPGIAGAEKRATALYDVVTNKGPMPADDDVFGNLIDPVLSEWGRDDQERLVLTETDIEGFIRYASLCHEVQGKGVLRMSIAQKADVYAIARQRFLQADRAEQIAMTSLGVVWPQVTKRWAAASYEQQQAWKGAAPLPESPDLEAVPYVAAVLEGDVVTAADTIHRKFGPLFFRDGEGYFHDP